MFPPAEEAEKLAAFLDHYGLGASASEQILGGYSSTLPYDGGRVQLQRPDVPPIDEPDFVPRLLEDEVAYDVILPWPTEPGGGGQSLWRRAVVLWGNDSASWMALDPSPAQVDLYLHPGDANLDGRTDVRDFNIWNAHKFTSGTDWTTGDFNGDGRTDVRDFNIWNAHKFTSAPLPAPVDAVLEEASVSDPTSRDAGLVELAWLHALEQSSTLRRPSDDNDPADAALDKLLASYWP